MLLLNNRILDLLLIYLGVLVKDTSQIAELINHCLKLSLSYLIANLPSKSAHPLIQMFMGHMDVKKYLSYRSCHCAHSVGALRSSFVGGGE